MTGHEEMVKARIYYMERTDEVVSVERNSLLWSVWWVQRLTDTAAGWIWRDVTVCGSLCEVAKYLRPDTPTLLLEELW